MNYDYYRCFYYVAKYRNLTRAAAAMFSNQPNVSRIMKLLESQLGCRLLVRSNKGIVLTEDGERLYAHVAAAFEQLQAGEEALARHTDALHGTVSIGASETALHLFMFRALGGFHAQYPHVRLKIYNYSSPQALAALRAGQIDFAVVSTPVEIAAPLRKKSLLSYREILVCGARDRAFAAAPRTPAEIAAHTLVGLEKSTATYALYQEYFLQHECPANIDIQVATSDLVLPMVENGLGIGFLPAPLAQKALAAGRVFAVPVTVPLPQRRVCLVHDAQRSPGAATALLKDWLLQAAADEEDAAHGA